MRNLILASAVAVMVSGGMVAAQAPAGAPAAASQDATAKLQAALQGTWVVVAVNGESIENQGVTMALTVDGNKYSQMVNGAVDETGTFTVDGTKKPAIFDLHIKEGSDAGKDQPGILEMKDDTIVVFLAAPGGSVRPKDFDSADGQIYVIAKKVK